VELIATTLALARAKGVTLLVLSSIICLLINKDNNSKATPLALHPLYTHWSHRTSVHQWGRRRAVSYAIPAEEAFVSDFIFLASAYEGGWSLVNPLSRRLIFPPTVNDQWVSYNRPKGADKRMQSKERRWKQTYIHTFKKARTKSRLLIGCWPE